MATELQMPDALLAKLYARRDDLGLELRRDLGLYLKLPVHFKDPQLAAELEEKGLNKAFPAMWEPDLTDGPTSSRFCVDAVDGKPARWDTKARQFTDTDGQAISADRMDRREYRQASTWAVLQNTLEQVEDQFGMGRRVEWAFDGPLQVSFPAGIQGNAYYLSSGRLDFYSYPAGDTIMHSCLSSDIVNHELGHAILDGTRPRFMGTEQHEIDAFHESFGDILALLIALRDNSFRKRIGELTEGDLTDNLASDMARQFGRSTRTQPHLRSAVSTLTMANMAGQNYHDASQILTAAVFSYLVRLAARHRKESGDSVAESLWRALRRVQATFLQAVDLLPPIAPTFADLGTAMVRMTMIYDPQDEDGYAAMLREGFDARGITLPPDNPPQLELTLPGVGAMSLASGAARWKPDRDAATVQADRAKAAEAARAWLEQNRTALQIPAGVTLEVDPPAAADLRRPDAVPLARRIAIPYRWNESVTISGITQILPCGATLVIDACGRPLSWLRKPGSETPAGSARLAGLTAQKPRSAPVAGFCCAPGIDDGPGREGGRS